MSINIYKPDAYKLIHKTQADFGGRRGIYSPIHVMQYDKTLPILAVELYKNNEIYNLPVTELTCKIKWSKPDRTFVYKNALGCNKDRNIVYFEIDEQMTSVKGNVYAIIELIINGENAGSSPLNVTVDANPIQNGDIESAIEMPLAPVAFTGDYNDLSNKPEAIKSLVQDYDEELPEIDSTNDKVIGRLDLKELYYPAADEIQNGKYNHPSNEDGKTGNLWSFQDYVNEINEKITIINDWEGALRARPYVPINFRNYWSISYLGNEDEYANYLYFDYPIRKIIFDITTAFNVSNLDGLVASDYSGAILCVETEGIIPEQHEAYLSGVTKGTDPNDVYIEHFEIEFMNPANSIRLYTKLKEDYDLGKINIYNLYVELDDAISVYDWKKLARQEDLDITNEQIETVKSNVQMNTDLIDECFDTIYTLEEKIGDITIYKVSNLPVPSVNYDNAIYKYGNQYYICKDLGESIHVDGDLSGLTYNQNPINAGYYPRIAEMLDNALMPTIAQNIYSDYGRLKFSSSSSLGSITFVNRIDKPMNKLTLNLKSYSGTKASVITVKVSRDGGSSYFYPFEEYGFLDEKTITINDYLPVKAGDIIVIESASYDKTQDRRFYLNSIIVDYGKAYYEWTPIVDDEKLSKKLDEKQNKITPGTYLDGPITVISNSNVTEPLNIDYSNDDTYFISIFDRDSGSSLKMDMNVLDECEMYVHFPIRENMNDTTIAYEEWVTSNYSSATNLQNGSGDKALQQKQDGTTGKFSFTGKNPHATALDPTLTGDINYGGTGNFSTVFGGKAAAIGKRSLAEGTTTIAKGNYSHAEGDNSVTLGSDSHAEGYQTLTGPSAMAAHSEGYGTQALAHSSHAEGYETIASTTATEIDRASLAPSGTESGSGTGTGTGTGTGSTANIASMHAEGAHTQATGNQAHAEGSFTQASGTASHAEGYLTVAAGSFSHAAGVYTTANGYGQTVVGVYNDPNDTDVFIVGIGTDKDHLANGLRVTKMGKVLIPNQSVSTVVGNEAVTANYVSNYVSGTHTTQPIVGRVPVFTDSGTIKSNSPITSDDVANKAYVDSKSGGGTQLYKHTLSTNGSGGLTLIFISVSNSAIRSDDGSLNFAAFTECVSFMSRAFGVPSHIYKIYLDSASTFHVETVDNGTFTYVGCTFEKIDAI